RGADGNGVLPVRDDYGVRVDDRDDYGRVEPGGGLAGCGWPELQHALSLPHGGNGRRRHCYGRRRDVHDRRRPPARPDGRAATATTTVVSNPAAVSLAAAGLSCNTLYHFRMAATGGAATVTGADATFTTGACPLPAVTTGSATTITASGATLNATVDPKSLS